jgi:hypothetical protein
MCSCRFRNSWNAVYVAGAWRFVQCNWGARHLVNAKEIPKPGKAKSESLRLAYDPTMYCVRNWYLFRCVASNLKKAKL